MGNCLRKNALDPNNQPLDVAKPLAGVPPPRKTCTTQQNKRPSHILQEIRIKHQRCDYHHREWRHSKSHRENDNIYINQSLPSNPRDIPAKMDGVYRARRLKCFCHKLLEAATRKFSKKNIIGEGGFGEVYIGYINSWTMTPAKRKDGVAIAVKKLRRKGTQGQDEWEVRGPISPQGYLAPKDTSLLNTLQQPYLSNKQELCRVVDERLGKNIRMEEAQEFAQIILRCLSLEPKTRPTMTQVVADLEQIELHMGGNQDFLRLSTCKKKPPL
ncbi:hypothetical protein Patl1_15831 [Pistacia atlantica]|uniref:Uncharacterized protein n=1 Tax=Pistacia atlantica TaxID=434234 RepID=A0ACC1B6B0_9ROSI|nr:hypothetical protein Patl1_15831 [Pistacia atlantica]